MSSLHLQSRGRRGEGPSDRTVCASGQLGLHSFTPYMVITAWQRQAGPGRLMQRGQAAGSSGTPHPIPA